MAKLLLEVLKPNIITNLNQTEINYLSKLWVEKLPRHIAIIMDGNGRWAQKRMLPRSAGHREGANALKRTVEFCAQLGIKVLTVYAFSTENWKRPKTEINLLMNLLVEYLQKEMDALCKNNVKIITSGKIEELPRDAYAEILKAKSVSKNNTGLILNVALNYGSRDEILKAVKEIAALVKDGVYDIEDINYSLMEAHLYTKGLPEPDLLIRTSGEKRLSNFLLWQLAYTELFFTDTLWPDFDKKDLLEALLSYQNRERRFGGLK
ncbi:MAG: Isoprenyl transferase [Clostridia bacterium 41_269]|nr:MAG: Isoprenyl transferase [Clostridia bacterium 41_269]